MVVLFVVLTVIVFLTIDYFVQRSELRQVAPAAAIAGQQVEPARTARSARSRMPFPIDRTPKGVFVGPGHTWMQLEPSGRLRLGVDALPLAALGGLTEIDIASAGTEVRKGEPVITLRHGRRSLAMTSPVDGVIEEVNDRVRTDPAALNLNPYGRNWLYSILPLELTVALKDAFVGEDAVAWMWDELRRLYDIVASLASGPSPVGVTAQDGGVPVEGFSEHLGDEQWNQLVERFFRQEQ